MTEGKAGLGGNPAIGHGDAQAASARRAARARLASVCSHAGRGVTIEPPHDEERRIGYRGELPAEAVGQP